MNDIEILDKAKAVTGSDYKTAKLIGLSRFGISHVRGGRRNLSPYQHAVLAEKIGKRWHEHALPALAAMAKSDAERAYWLGKSKTLARIAGKATAGVFLIITAASHYQTGKQIDEKSYGDTMNGIYIAHFYYIAQGTNHCTELLWRDRKFTMRIARQVTLETI